MTAMHIMEYLKQRYNSHLFLDPTHPLIDKTTFKYGADWKEFYSDATKAIPSYALEPRGKAYGLCMMVDSEYAGDKANRRSQTGFII